MAKTCSSQIIMFPRFCCNFYLKVSQFIDYTQLYIFWDWSGNNFALAYFSYPAHIRWLPFLCSSTCHLEKWPFVTPSRLRPKTDSIPCHKSFYPLLDCLHLQKISATRQSFLSFPTPFSTFRNPRWHKLSINTFGSVWAFLGWHRFYLFIHLLLKYEWFQFGRWIFCIAKTLLMW